MKMQILTAVLMGLISVAGFAQEFSVETESMRPELGKIKDRIVYESHRTGNFDLWVMNADGSNPKNLTNTADTDEIFAQCSPDGKLIAFEACDNKTTGAQFRIELMNPDGSGRHTILENARQMAWSPDGSRLCFSTPTGGKRRYNQSKDLSFYDVKTKKITRWADGKTTVTYIKLDGTQEQHPVSDVLHVLNPTWSKDGKWIFASVGGMWGIVQTIVGIEVDGDRVVNFIHQERKTTNGVLGCRPTVSPDGKWVTWAIVEPYKLTWIGTAPIDFSAGYPKAGKQINAAYDKHPWELYHPDWSPDGGHIAFSRGPRGGRMQPAPYAPGALAKEWDICIVDPKNPMAYLHLTTDGESNKEPDWLKAAE